MKKSFKTEEEFKKKKKIQVNAITVSRGLGGLALIPAFFHGGGAVAAVVALIFFLTDWIDGRMARKYGVSTFFGALADTLSDKIFGVIALLLLSTVSPLMLLPLFMEFAITIQNLINYKQGKNIKSSVLGKFKTGVLATSVVASFLATDIPGLNQVIHYINLQALETLKNIDSENLLKIFSLSTAYCQTAALINYSLVPKEDEMQKDLQSMQIRPFSEIKHDLFDIEYYKKHKDDGIKRLVLKPKNTNVIDK